MSRGSAERRARAALEAALGHRFGAPELLEQALTHASFANEHEDAHSNERLEFLGDAVLDLVLAHRLYERHPGWQEGELTLARKSLVNTRDLAVRARSLGLGRLGRLGRSELHSGGAEKDSILTNLFEAVVGALYLDGGLAPVERFAARLFGPALRADSPGERDPKTRLQEWAHARHQRTPRYCTVADSGVEYDERRFAVEVLIDGEPVGRGVGRSKRAAEQRAAEAALRSLAGSDD